MDATKRKAIEAAGWKVGDAADFLNMSEDERQLLDSRISRSPDIMQTVSVNPGALESLSSTWGTPQGIEGTGFFIFFLDFYLAFFSFGVHICMA